MLTQEQHKKRLEALMEKNPRINRNAHLRDLELCKRYMEGDQAPFEDMFQVAYIKLRKYVCSDSCGKHSLGINISAEDKEDLIADVASTAILQMNMYNGWSLFFTWMKAIARYRILSLIKKRCIENKNLIFGDVHETEITPASQVQNNEMVIFELLSCLSETDSKIVQLKAIEELSFLEISKQLNLSCYKVKMRYKKAIASLRDTI